MDILDSIDGEEEESMNESDGKVAASLGVYL